MRRRSEASAVDQVGWDDPDDHPAPKGAGVGTECSREAAVVDVRRGHAQLPNEGGQHDDPVNEGGHVFSRVAVKYSAKTLFCQCLAALVVFRRRCTLGTERVKITLASGSGLKRRALEGALKLLGVDYALTSISSVSGVNEQPVGFVETRKGALNRARFVCRAVWGNDFVIGIENGLFHDDEVYIDVAVIVVTDGLGEVLVSTMSEGLEFPRDVVLAAKRKGFDRHTAGAELARLYGCASNDPHSLLTRGLRSRESYLVPAIVMALAVIDKPRREGPQKMLEGEE